VDSPDSPDSPEVAAPLVLARLGRVHRGAARNQREVERIGVEHEGQRRRASHSLATVEQQRDPRELQGLERR
jgi:hypothetical protein